MSTAQLMGLSAAQAKLADRIAGRVEPTLEGGSSGVAAVQAAAQIASLAAVAASELPASVLAQISEQKDLFLRLVNVLKGFANSQSDEEVSDTSVAKGSGLGAILSVDQGRKAIHDIAVDLPLEEWAGPMAGSTEIERDLGIRRQTLNNWRNDGDVIAFLKGVSKHVYPKAQFVDGRPVRGLAEIVTVAGSPRTAWLWLTEKNPVLGKAPIDLLRRDEVGVVTKAAEDYFLGL